MQARVLIAIVAAITLGRSCDRSGTSSGSRVAAQGGAADRQDPAPVPKAALPPPPEPPALPPLPTIGEGDGSELHYHEVILGDADPQSPLPMIVAIHGLGDHPRNFGRLFETFPERARLILPQGIDPTEGDGWSWFPIRARSPDVEALATGIASSTDRLAAALDVLVSDKPTAGKPIVTGFSQGGMLTFALAVRHPDAIGAAVAVGGWLPPPMWPDGLDRDRYPHLWALHGTADSAVRFEPTAEAVNHLRKLGFPITLHAYEGVQHVITPEIRRDLFDRLADAVREAARAGSGDGAQPTPR